MFTDRALASLNLLSDVSSKLVGQFDLVPLLEVILEGSLELLGCTSGSLTLMNRREQTYQKVVDIAAGCQAGRIFPLSEGLTGKIAENGATVVLDHYSEVQAGHLPVGDPLLNHSVIGVPIIIKTMVEGALIVFANDPDTRFTSADAQLLELFANHASIALENSRAHATAAERAKEVAALAERERVILELHDSIGRRIANVIMELKNVDVPHGTAQDIQDALQRQQTVLEQVIQVHQRLLNPSLSVLRNMTLAGALQQVLEGIRARRKVRVAFREVGDEEEVPLECASTLFTLAKEVLSVIDRFANASTIRVGILHQSGTTSIIIEDDGSGFDPSVISHTRSRLEDMMIHATRLGGEVEVESTLGWGTNIRLTLSHTNVSNSYADKAVTRVMVIHPNLATRTGLVHLLEQSDIEVKVVGEFANEVKLMDAIQLLDPDVILIGEELLEHEPRDILTLLSQLDKRIALLLYADEAGDSITEWVASGAQNIIPSSVRSTELSRAVIAATRGDALIFKPFLQRIHRIEYDRVNESLTRREAQIHSLLSEGLSDRQIADRLDISVRTVEKHVSAVLRKFGAKNRVSLLV